MPEVEDRARNMGWLPQEEFRGNPDNWVPAEKFVELAETSLPHLKGTLKVLERKLSSQDELLRRQSAEMAGLRQDMSEFVEFSKGAEQRAYEKAVRELQGKQLQAKEAGDLPAYAQATEDLNDLVKTHPAVTGEKKPLTEEKKPAASAANPEYESWMTAEPGVFDTWVGEHKWFNEDPDMFDYAQKMDRFLMNKHGLTRPRSQHLDDVAEAVKKKFPSYFSTPARKGGSPVEGDKGGAPSGGDQHTYNNLPPDVKKQCDKWAGADGKGTGTMGPKFTREDYLKNYKW